MAQAVEIVDELQRMRETALERSLVTAAADGSSAAFEQLYRRHAARVHALCLRMTGNVATAEDCTQEAFVQAWRSLPRFETLTGLIYAGLALTGLNHHAGAAAQALADECDAGIDAQGKIVVMLA